MLVLTHICLVFDIWYSLYTLWLNASAVFSSYTLYAEPPIKPSADAHKWTVIRNSAA